MTPSTTSNKPISRTLSRYLSKSILFLPILLSITLIIFNLIASKKITKRINFFPIQFQEGIEILFGLTGYLTENFARWLLLFITIFKRSYHTFISIKKNHKSHSKVLVFFGLTILFFFVTIKLNIMMLLFGVDKIMGRVETRLLDEKITFIAILKIQHIKKWLTLVSDLTALTIFIMADVQVFNRTRETE